MVSQTTTPMGPWPLNTSITRYEGWFVIENMDQIQSFIFSLSCYIVSLP